MDVSSIMTERFDCQLAFIGSISSSLIARHYQINDPSVNNLCLSASLPRIAARPICVVNMEKFSAWPSDVCVVIREEGLVAPQGL